MLLLKLRLEASIETHPRPLLIEGRFEVPSKKRGYKGCVCGASKSQSVTQKLSHGQDAGNSCFLKCNVSV